MKKIQIFSILLLIIFCLLLIYYFRIVNHNELIFTHLFYIPIILAGFWWQYRGIYVIVCLASALFITDFYISNSIMILHDFFRSLVFLLVGITVAFLRSERLKLDHLKIYRSVISSMREPVAIFNSTGNIIIKNGKFSALFAGAEPWLHNFKSFMEDTDFSEFSNSLNRCLKNEVVSFSAPMILPDSSFRFFKINFYPLENGSSVRDVALSFWDITDCKKNEENLNTAIERQKVVIDVLDLLNKQKHGSGVIKDILDLLRRSSGIEFLGIILNKDGEFRLEEVSGSDEEFIKTINSACPFIMNGIIEQGGFSLCGRSFERYYKENSGGRDEAALFWCNDLDALTADEGTVACDCIRVGNYKSAAVIPFSGGDGLLGFFILLDRNSNFFNQEIVDFYYGVIQSVGIALNRVNYEESLKKTITEKEHLIREVHHRVKNNMQVITSLISLQTSRQKDENVRSILNDCQNRVRTMALVHERLYSSNNFSSINFHNYIESFVPMLINSFSLDRQKVKVSINVSDVSLNLSTAIPLAQLINEILSNSLKHAFTNGRIGNVSLSLVSVEAENELILTISDDGPGFPPYVTFPQNGNLGFQLIDALIKQLRGRLTLSTDRGISFMVSFKGV